MFAIYVMWGAMPLIFIVLLLAMRAREDRVAKRTDSAIDPMFRPVRRKQPGAGQEKSRAAAEPVQVVVRPIRPRRPAPRSLNPGGTP
jgi:hypothetical protein